MASAVETVIRSVVTKGVTAVASINRSLKDKDRDHPYLTGIHTPMAEERTIENLAVTGAIPPELDGRYVRNGPNPFAPDPRGHHWFIGDGMVHGVRIKDGKALWYRNRYIRSLELEQRGGPKAAPGPRRGRRDLVNTNIIQHNGAILAVVEAGSFPAQLDGNLETVAYTDFGGSLTVPFSAHPHKDPLTGELHAIVYDGMTQDTVWHVVVSPEGRVTRQEPVAVKDGPSIHECSITANYVLVFDLPVTFSLGALVAGQQFPFGWNSAHRARVGLLPRAGKGSETIWCDVDPCYVFHVANSFEREDGVVVCDMSVHETMFAGGPDGPNGKPIGMERWLIDPVARKVERTTLDSAPQEFHRPDERFFGQPYRYAWSLGLPEDSDGFLGEAPIYRFDLETGTRQVRDFGPGKVAGEFVFVPRSADAAEGDGWIMGYVIDTAAETTDLVILDAADITSEPVASIHIPHRIPPGFHGNWLAEA